MWRLGNKALVLRNRISGFYKDNFFYIYWNTLKFPQLSYKLVNFFVSFGRGPSGVNG